MFTKQFWQDATERAVKTFAQTLVTVLGAGAVNVLTVDWKAALAVSGGAALVSILTSLGSEPFGRGGTASVTDAVEPAGSVTVQNINALTPDELAEKIREQRKQDGCGE